MKIGIVGVIWLLLIIAQIISSATIPDTLPDVKKVCPEGLPEFCWCDINSFQIFCKNKKD